MKLAPLVWIPLLALSSPREEDELRVVYSTDEAVAFEHREWFSMEPGDVSMRINGEDVPPEQLEKMGVPMTSQREEDRVRFTTWFEALEDDRPVRARRRFDALTRTKVEDGVESEEEGALSGLTLVLSRSTDDDAVEVRTADGEDVEGIDGAFLENHRLRLELERYLPDRPVAVGSAWSLDDAVLRAILEIDEEGPRYFESDDESDDPIVEAMDRAARFAGEVLYDRREDVDGVACAVLVISLSVETDGVEVDPAAFGMDEEGIEASAKLAIEMEVKARLWFAIEAGRPIKTKSEMEGSMRISMAMSNAQIGLDMEFELGADMKGGSESEWSYGE